jgi:hypothetical protein
LTILAKNSLFGSASAGLGSGESQGGTKMRKVDDACKDIVGKFDGAVACGVVDYRDAARHSQLGTVSAQTLNEIVAAAAVDLLRGARFAKLSWAALIVGLIAPPLIGQSPMTSLREVEPWSSWTLPSTKAGSGCSGGIQYDDGTFEDGYGWNNSTIGGKYAMRFDLLAAGTKITAACVCWQHIGSPASVTYKVVVWAADGPGGSPGTLIKISSLQTATSVGLSPKFFRVDLSDTVSTTDKVYIGADWSPLFFNSFFICADESGPGNKPAYAGTGESGSPPTLLLGVPAASPDYKALGIRAELDPTTIPACTPTSSALCLNNGRFRVEATFEAAGQPVGSAQVVKLTEETGYLWFFNSANVEAVVKVLNGCALNNRYWVFAGGLTDVRVVLTVTDTKNGTIKTYVNPQGAAFQPIQDTSAFATCP